MIKTVDALNICNTLEMNRVEHIVLTKYFIQQNLQEKLLNIYQQSMESESEIQRMTNRVDGHLNKPSL